MRPKHNPNTLKPTSWDAASFYMCAHACVYMPFMKQVHCFTGLQALIKHANEGLMQDRDVSVLAAFDHEEVGSSSTHGAGSPIIKDVVERVNECFGIFGTSARGGGEAFKMSLRQSFVMSADVAHALLPNYAQKHEKNHGPMLNAGTVIKTNSNQVTCAHTITRACPSPPAHIHTCKDRRAVPSL
jgi:aspartyl aminopeptidase